MRQISNAEIAAILRGISEYLVMENVLFKPQAYARAALSVEESEEELRDVYQRGGIKELRTIPGIGQSIAEHIEELIKTGRLAYYENLKKSVPIDVAGLTLIEGLGPKSIQKLHAALGIRTLKDIEKAAKSGKIRDLRGFGAKAEEKILKGLEFAKTAGVRFRLGQVMPRVASLERRLNAIKGVTRLMVAGSIRRRKETVGDADILVAGKDPAPIVKAFVTTPGVVRVLAEGGTRAAIKFGSGLNVDLRVVPENSWGAALNYFTGSKAHNVTLRQMAIKKGYKLNEYGLWKGTVRHGSRQEKQVAGKNEEELYAALGLEYIEPELRENTGEIEAARSHALPRIVGYKDLQGDLQVQTDWTDGTASIEAMARAAAARGLKYIAITDHTKRLAMTNGLDGKRLFSQMAEIDKINRKLGGAIKVLKGTECDILKDGSLDIEDEVLAKLDVVGISVHSYFNLTKEEQTARILKAMQNPHADILFHPTGRIIGRRSAYELDMDAVIAMAKKTGVVLEANAYPDRLDLKDEHIRKAVEAGVKISIDSDAHAPQHFALLEYGIAQARRGWAEKKDVINAWPVERMLACLKK